MSRRSPDDASPPSSTDDPAQHTRDVPPAPVRGSETVPVPRARREPAGARAEGTQPVTPPAEGTRAVDVAPPEGTQALPPVTPRGSGGRAHTQPVTPGAHAAPDVAADDDGPALVPGATLGRFVLLQHLGSGGMGAVFLAQDTRLERRVALKALLPAARRVLGEASRGRLIREAQAMAQLSHPNVVAVHEAGVAQGQPYIVMEYVEGQTLRAWLAGGEGGAPRPWREVLHAYAQAGRGLAAAHAKGLIHRDFKPDNVLVDPSGHVRVTDFGLAHVELGDDATPGGALSRSDWTTRTGVAMGTPRYMAPEQHAGARDTDARADQFSFCVSLHEALFGQHPFFAETLDGVVERVVAGDVSPPPAGSPVPARVRRALARGLAHAPADRHASMEDLLRELDTRPDELRRRRLVGAGVALVAGVLAVAGWARWQQAASQVCAGAEARLAGVWDAATRAAVEKAFGATGVPYAKDSFARVAGALDAYAAGWARQHREACEATAVRKEQSEQLLDLRMGCLERRRGTLASLTQQLSSPLDSAALERAPIAAAALESPATCADAEWLLGALPPPSDPKVRAEVDALRRRIDEADALRALARRKEALAVATEVAEKARALGYPPVEAEAELSLGIAQYLHDIKDFDAHLRRAVLRASASRDDRLVVRAWSALISRSATSGNAGAAASADALGLGFEAAAARLRPDAPERLAVARARSNLARAKGDHEAALVHVREAYAEEERQGNRVEMATSLSSEGMSYVLLGRYADARAPIERALALQREVLGPRHPAIAQTMDRLGYVLGQLGEEEAALRLQREALSISREAYGDKHNLVPTSMSNLGSTLLDLGRYDEALAMQQQALALAEGLYGQNHLIVGLVRINLADALYRLGRYPEAREQSERALAVADALGKDGGKRIVGAATSGVAKGYYGEGDFARSIAWGRKALEVHDGRDGPQHPSSVGQLYNLATFQFAAGRAAEACETQRTASARLAALEPKVRAKLEGADAALRGQCLLHAGRAREALAALESVPAKEGLDQRDPVERGLFRHLLAQALWKGGGDRARAVKLIQDAVLALQGARGPLAARTRTDLERWLLRHAAVAATATAAPAAP